MAGCSLSNSPRRSSTIELAPEPHGIAFRTGHVAGKSFNSTRRSV
jgi:hypothetical protein